MSEFVHQFVPASPTGPSFTVLALHGTGGDESSLLSVAQALAPGAAVLSPRGKVLENGQARFFRRIAEGVFDVKDVKFRAQELADFIEAASARYGFDRSRVAAVGYSNGANIAAALLLLRPEVLAAALLFRAMVPFEPSEPPDLRRKPVLICAGRQDQIVGPEEPTRLAKLLGDAGAAVTLHWSERGHRLAAEEITAARDWLSVLHFVGAASAPAS